MKSLCILGRQPKLGIAELEALYGEECLVEFGKIGALINIDPKNIEFDRLGGTIKLARVLEVIESTNWDELEKFALNEFVERATDQVGGKLTLGLSAYNLDIKVTRLNHAGLTIKKKIHGLGKSVRFVPNKELALSSAQVIYNKLTSKNGMEILFVADKERTVIAQTIREQDINSYSFRDRERPKRDSRVGMLPPKLAQIIINLATGPNKDGLLLDPFCGTGVILQEALLMGYRVEGTDLDQRMIDYSTTNIEWLTKNYKITRSDHNLEIGDATNHVWGERIDFIASEAYLGQAFTRQLTDNEIAQNIANTNLIIKKTLQNISKQVSGGTRICLAVPAYHTSRGDFKHLGFIDSIEELGYNRVRFEHLENDDLLYFRENQFVARELLVITRK